MELTLRDAEANPNVAESPTKVRRALGGVVATIGFILSPLTWWNDAFVNIPIAWCVATAISVVRRDWFEPALYLAYLGTNVLGLVMMHFGVRMGLVSPSASRIGTLRCSTATRGFALTLPVPAAGEATHQAALNRLRQERKRDVSERDEQGKPG